MSRRRQAGARGATMNQFFQKILSIKHLQILICISLLPSTAFDQSIYWRQTDGPSGGTVRSFAGYGNYILASMTSNGYIYLSSDQGRSWQIINAQNSPLSSVATNSNTIFAIGSYQTLSSSTDLGRTWNTRYIQIQGYPQLTGLWAFANKLYLGTASGFYASIDGGTSWSQSLLSDQVVEDIEQSSQALYIGTNNGVFSSTDEGATFWIFTTWIRFGHSYLQLKSICGHSIRRHILFNRSWKDVDKTRFNGRRHIILVSTKRFSPNCRNPV